MWMVPLHLHVNQKSDFDDVDNDMFCLFLSGSLRQVLLYIALSSGSLHKSINEKN